MTFTQHITTVIVVVLLLPACNNSDNANISLDTPNIEDKVVNNKTLEEGIDSKNSLDKKPSAISFQTIEWTELMPEGDIEALLNPPSYITDIEDGSLEDQISNQLQNAIGAASDDRYQKALVSTGIIEEMNNRAVRIPGFIVPLEFSDDQSITQFFLVPFFGACIHIPPPPPNQIILVDYPQGLKLENLYTPFWISGILETSVTTNDVATSAYSMSMHIYEAYSE